MFRQSHLRPPRRQPLHPLGPDESAGGIDSRHSPMNRRFGSQLSKTVLATVTNTDSSDHVIAVNVGCEADDGSPNGCRASAHPFTMRVGVFTP